MASGECLMILEEGDGRAVGGMPVAPRSGGHAGPLLANGPPRQL
jgi:hypothetical protein